jgi:hypothetical protein
MYSLAKAPLTSDSRGSLGSGEGRGAAGRLLGDDSYTKHLQNKILHLAKRPLRESNRAAVTFVFRTSFRGDGDRGLGLLLDSLHHSYTGVQ